MKLAQKIWQTVKLAIPHPLILSTFPVISLYITNITYVPFLEMLFYVLIVLTAAVGLWVLLSFFLFIEKAALIVSVFFMLFFFFSDFLTSVASLSERYLSVQIAALMMDRGSLSLPAMRLLMVIWVLLFGLVVYLVVKSNSDFKTMTHFLNFTSLALAALMIFQAARWAILYSTTQQEAASAVGETRESSIVQPIRQANPPTTPQPDIYYIILDGYARQDILRDIYHYDNQSFINDLGEMGFYVGEESTSNYGITMLSLASSLNVDYIELPKSLDATSGNPLPVLELLQNSRVIEYLTRQGYLTISYQSGYYPTELIKTQISYGYTAQLTGFQTELINKTPLVVPLFQYPYDLHRQRILYTLDQLPDTERGQAPIFVFAHILAPHPPFVFQADGSAYAPTQSFTLNDGTTILGGREQAEYVTHYRQQIEYITRQVKMTVQEILVNAKRPTIIIIQGDHGPGSQLDVKNPDNSNPRERMSILNAYYFPDQDYQKLTPTITPVNSFRVILDQYLGTELGLLNDRNFFSVVELPYQFEDVTDLLHHP